MLPGSWTVNCNSSSSIGKNTSIETSESLPVNVNPSSLATNFNPCQNWNRVLMELQLHIYKIF